MNVDIELPPPPEKIEQGVSVDKSDEGLARYFIFNGLVNSRGELVGYSVSGLTYDGKQMVKLTIPHTYNGLPVRI